MAIDNFTEYLTRRRTPYEIMPFHFASKAVTAGRLNSLWANNVFGRNGVGTYPGLVATQCTNATTGALQHRRTGGADKQRIAAMTVYSAQPVSLLLLDRLSHESGYNANAAAGEACAINLPSRITDNGVGVRMACEVITQIGTTQVAWEYNYTNVAGTASRNSAVGPLYAWFGATGQREAGFWQPFPLAVDSDSGVRSVEFVGAGTGTGTAGNYAATLYRPRAWFTIPGSPYVQRIDLGVRGASFLPEIHDEDCLYFVVASPLTATGTIQGYLETIIDT